MITKLWKALTDWNFVPATEEQMRAAQLIVTQAWSRRGDQRPGRGNMRLAIAAENISLKTGLPVLPQEEVAWAMALDTKLVGIAGGSKTGGSTMEWNTESVALIQLEYCREHGITRVIVVAHPLHMNRALWVYRKLGLQAVAADVPRDLSAYQDPELVHWHFRHHWMLPIAWSRELLARILFVLKGKV